jgi:F420-dependent oxidoreductase-like protein
MGQGEERPMAVRFGVFVPQGWRQDLVGIGGPIEQYEAMTAVAKAADALPGIDSIWVYDHFLTVPTITLETTFECWSITAGLARDTKRVRVGQMVSCNGYRNPALLAKMASTVDVMSHGRLNFGLGAGWYEAEYTAFGYQYPEVKVRMAMFREACELITRMWTQEHPSFEGKHYRITDAINQPQGVQKPYPSFWIGGGGEQVTLKLVAKYGAACNVMGDPETLQRKFAVLRGHCEAQGRNYDEIIRSTSMSIVLVRPGEDPEQATERIRKLLGLSFEDLARMATVATPDQLVAQVQEKVDAGVTYIIFYLNGIAYDQEPLHILAEQVIPRFQ